MRTDIPIDYNTGELILRKQPSHFSANFTWTGEDDYFVYGRCELQNKINIQHLQEGIGAIIPWNSKYKKVKISFWVKDGSNNTHPILNTRNSSSYFILQKVNGEELYASELPTISDKQTFSLMLVNNAAYIYDMYSYDLEICESLEQNKMFLLQCYEGNLYQYPTTGVGLPEYLNGNIQSSLLSEKIKQEFNQDGMYVESASINSDTGEISITAKEL